MSVSGAVVAFLTITACGDSRSVTAGPRSDVMIEGTTSWEQILKIDECLANSAAFAEAKRLSRLGIPSQWGFCITRSGTWGLRRVPVFINSLDD